jgi:HEAT repeat protein
MSRHLDFGLATATLFAALFSASPCVSQGCEELKLASATDAVNALDRGEIRTAFCSRAAFQLIGNLPPEQAVPILIKYLGFMRPKSNEVQHGLPSPYPAVDALAKVGLAAEPALIDFIAQQEDDSSLQRANAVDALDLIRHGDAVPTIKLMRERSAELAGTPAASRLDSAAHYMLRKYCPGKLRQHCEERLKSDVEK